MALDTYKYSYKFIQRRVDNTHISRITDRKKIDLGSPKMINGSRGRECICVDTFTDFTVNRALLNGYVLLRNAIVRECLLRCHGRMPAVMGRILPNGITTGTIMAQSTRR